MSKKKRYDDLNQDLSTILKTYPTLSVVDVDAFIPVYFPIALVEIDTVEESFEDFEVIELTVLKLVSLGVETSHEISELLAIDEKYVKRVLKLLIGYGHIKNNKITEIGLRSLERGQKIEKKAGKQIFQVNALNGTIMKFEDVISERQLDDREHTRFRVAHMMNMMGVRTQSLIDQLKTGDNYMNFVNSGKNEIVNLVGIQDIQLKEKQYAYSYILKIKGYNPMVLSKRYNMHKRKIDERYQWIPLSVPNPIVRQRLNLSESIPVSTMLEKKIIQETMGLLKSKTENIEAQEMKQTYLEAIINMYPFVTSACAYKGLENGCEFFVKEQAFNTYNRKLYEILKSFGQYGIYVFGRDNFYGNFVKIRPSSIELQNKAELLVKYINDYGDNKIRQVLGDYFDLNDQSNVIEGISKALNQFTGKENG